MPEADRLLPEITKAELKKEIKSNLPDLPPAEVKKVVQKIDEQLEELPDSFNISKADSLRRAFRNAAVDARGVQKSDSHFASLENATRDIIFKRIDQLPGANGSFASSQKFVKDNINAIEYLDRVVRGKKPKGGQMTKLITRVTGVVAGSPGGIFGAAVGAFAGDIIGDVLSNRALSNKVKREMLVGMSDGTPEQIKAIDEILANIPETKLLGSPTTEFRRQEFGAGIIKLPADIKSTRIRPPQFRAGERIQ